MPATTDRDDPRLREHTPDGQQRAYLVLSDEERAKGWVRPYRDSYQHTACGTVTTMGRPIAETYARDPSFYGGTYCTGCRTHLPLAEFRWVEGGKVTDLVVGS